MSMIINPFMFAPPAAGNTLTAEPGAFALTGNPVAFKRALRMSAAPGAFGITGKDANLNTGNAPLVAATGTFAFTGNDVSFKRSLRMSAAAGVFSLTGNASTLTYVQNDPHFSSVVLLCGFNGVDGATSSSDESSSGKSLSFSGNAQLDTAQFKFGTASLLLDGSSDRVAVSDSLDWQLGSTNSSPWTVECWVRWNVLDLSNRGILAQWDGGSQRAWTFAGATTVGELSFSLSTTGAAFDTTVTTSGASMTTGVWYHVAADKDSSGKIRVYVDGVMLGSATPSNSAIFNSTAALAIGAQSSTGTNDMNGWLDEIRITKGVARYASDSGFTVPTTAFPRS